MIIMKFETKMAKLGVNEEEVKSIIANCFCGEVNGAYFIDLTKEKKEFIMEVVGNYIDDGSEEFEGWTDIKRIATFCKVFDISEDEIADYYRLGFNEGGCDIAYNLESNKDVILVLTDDERYTNSFIKYSPSQTGEIDLYEKEMEELEAEYIRLGELEPTKEPLTIFDDETEDIPATRFVAKYNGGDKYIYDVKTQLELTMEDAMELLNHTVNENRFSLKTLSTGNVLLKDANVRRLYDVFDTVEILNSLCKNFEEDESSSSSVSSSPAEESEPKVLIKTIENQEYSNNGDYIENIEQHLKAEGFEIDESTIVYEDMPFITCTEDTIEFIESAEITYVDDNRFYSIKQDQVGDYMVYTGKRDNTQKLEDYLSDNLFKNRDDKMEEKLESFLQNEVFIYDEE